MNKKEYTEMLARELGSLPYNDVREITAEIEEHFNMAVESGKTEEQAADEVGLAHLALAECCDAGVVLGGIGDGLECASALHQLLELLVVVIWTVVLDPCECLVDFLYLVVQNVFYHILSSLFDAKFLEFALVEPVFAVIDE